MTITGSDLLPLMEELVAIARVVRPRGLRGEAVAEVLTDFPERFERLSGVIVLLADGTRDELKIEKHWFQKDRIILKFAGLDSIESVEPLRDAEICIDEADAVKLADGEYFDWELSGCSVTTLDGEIIGEVSGIMRTCGTEILSIIGPEKDFLVPFAESICTEVDIENKRIVIDPPEGLLDF